MSLAGIPAWAGGATHIASTSIRASGACEFATLYSLVQTGKANGIDPYRYLSALFIARPKAGTVDDYEALLRWRIALAAQ